MDLAIAVDPAATTPLHRQVYEGLRTAILDGHLRPGDRLPATRNLAEALSLSRATVAEAYDQLRTEGYVHGRQGSGTYVAPGLPDEAPPTSNRKQNIPLSTWGRHVAADETMRWRLADHGEMRFDLRPHRVATDVFPWEAWSAAVDRALAQSRADLLTSPPGAGHPALRAAIAAHVATYRAVSCSPDQVVIVGGSQQGLNLLVQLLLEPGDRVAVEDPGYPIARLAFEARGLDVSRIPVDEEGMIVDLLAAAGPQRVVHVTPSHQDPTGATLSLTRRLALLELAERHGTVVVEDDYDSEFRFEGRPVESLQGLDAGGLVVYAGTFSKSVLPGLRLGFLILPPPLVGPFVAAKSMWDGGTPMLEQAALAEFMRSGEHERHIRRMRRIYRSRRDALIAALHRCFGDRAVVGPRHGGLNLLVTLDIPSSSAEVVHRAAQQGITLRSAAPYYRTPPPQPTFLMGFAASTEEELAAAIELLAAVVNDPA